MLEAIRLFMRRLQIRLFGPDFSFFSAHSYGYELSNERKSVRKLPDFRFCQQSRAASQDIEIPLENTGIMLYSAALST